jgi:hypothetical protein
MWDKNVVQPIKNIVVLAVDTARQQSRDWVYSCLFSPPLRLGSEYASYTICRLATGLWKAAHFSSRENGIFTG